MKSPFLVLASFCLALTTQAQTVVYENLGTGATAGYSEPNANNPIFGDALSLNQGGHLSFVGLAVYNSGSGGNTGPILTGSMVVNFYDNTVPYAGGVLNNPLLGTATLNWDFRSLAGGGLLTNFFATSTFDLTGLNINLTQNILVTQQFTELTGTSTRNGIVLFSNPTVGSSPPSVYIKSSGTPEGLYSFSGGNPNQFGYHIEIQTVPEPGTMALACLGVAALMIFRRRK